MSAVTKTSEESKGSSPEVKLRPGEAIAGFVVLDELPASTPSVMARRYLAWDRERLREVSLSAFAGIQRAGKRFLGEAEILRQITSKALPGVIATEAHGDLLVLVQAWEPSLTLRRLLAAGPLPEQVSGRILWSLTQALHDLHARGLVHGCVTPDTVELTRRGEVRLLGAYPTPANLLVQTYPDTEKTRRYTPPEWTSRRALLPTGDVYALGLLGLELFTGRPAFAAANLEETVELQERLVSGLEGPLLEYIPRSLHRILRRMLEHDRNIRPVTAMNLVSNFEQSLSGTGMLEDPRKLVRPRLVLPVQDAAERLLERAERRTARGAFLQAAAWTQLFLRLVSPSKPQRKRVKAVLHQVLWATFDAEMRPVAAEAAAFQAMRVAERLKNAALEVAARARLRAVSDPNGPLFKKIPKLDAQMLQGRQAQLVKRLIGEPTCETSLVGVAALSEVPPRAADVPPAIHRARFAASMGLHRAAAFHASQALREASTFDAGLRFLESGVPEALRPKSKAPGQTADAPPPPSHPDEHETWAKLAGASVPPVQGEDALTSASQAPHSAPSKSQADDEGPPSFDEAPPSFDAPPPSFDAPPPSFDAPPPGFDEPPPGTGAIPDAPLSAPPAPPAPASEPPPIKDPQPPPGYSAVPLPEGSAVPVSAVPVSAVPDTPAPAMDEATEGSGPPAESHPPPRREGAGPDVDVDEALAQVGVKLAEEDLGGAAEQLAAAATSRRYRQEDHYASLCDLIRRFLWVSLLPAPATKRKDAALEKALETIRAVRFDAVVQTAERLLIASIPEEERSARLETLLESAPQSIPILQAASRQAADKGDDSAWIRHLTAAGDTFLEAGEMALASKMFQALRAIDPSSKDAARGQKAVFSLAESTVEADQAWRQIQTGMEAAGDEREALDLVEPILERFPNYQPAIQLAARLNERTGNQTEAARLYMDLATRALYREEDTEARKLLRHVQHNDLGGEEALMLLAILEPPPIDAPREVWRFKVQLLQREGLEEAAIYQARKQLTGEPSDFAILGMLTQLCRKAGKDPSPHLLAQGFLAWDQGDSKMAQDCFEMALEQAEDRDAIATELVKREGIQDIIPPEVLLAR